MIIKTRGQARIEKEVQVVDEQARREDPSLEEIIRIAQEAGADDLRRSFFRVYREGTGLSREQFAVHLGVEPNVVSDLENGALSPDQIDSQDLPRRYAEVLGNPDIFADYQRRFSR